MQDSVCLSCNQLLRNDQLIASELASTNTARKTRSQVIAVFFEALRGAQEIADFNDLVHNPYPNTSEIVDEKTDTSSTKNYSKLKCT